MLPMDSSSEYRVCDREDLEWSGQRIDDDISRASNKSMNGNMPSANYLDNPQNCHDVKDV